MASQLVSKSQSNYSKLMLKCDTFLKCDTLRKNSKRNFNSAIFSLKNASTKCRFYDVFMTFRRHRRYATTSEDYFCVCVWSLVCSTMNKKVVNFLLSSKCWDLWLASVPLYTLVSPYEKYLGSRTYTALLFTFDLTGFDLLVWLNRMRKN